MKQFGVGLEERSSLSCSKLRARYEGLCDLHPHPQVRAELDDALRGTGLDIAFWTYETRRSSGLVREGANGAEPLLQIHLRTSADLATETGIDPHRGNWGDSWTRTATIRDAANSIFAKAGLGEDFRSLGSFIFVDSWEQYCWRKVAYESEGAVRELAMRLVVGRWHRFRPGSGQCASVYSGSAWDRPAPGAFNIIFDREDDMKRAKAMTAQLQSGCSDILRRGRHDGCIDNFDVCIQIWWSGMSLPPLYRRD